jgi:hypothetical protein
MLIDVKAIQFEKANLPIEVTEDGMDIVINSLHLSKAFSPIDLMDEGISIDVNFEQP